MLKYFQILASTKSSVVLSWILLEGKTLESREMFISWNCGAPFCNFEYLIQGNSQFFFQKMHILSENTLGFVLWFFTCCFLVPTPVQFSCSVMSDSLRPHESQHARPPCPSSTPGVYLNSCASSGDAIQPSCPLSSPFPPAPKSLPASGSFPMSHLFARGGQSIGFSASAPFLPTNTQDWSPLGWIGCISLQSKGLSKVFFNTTV